MYKVQHEFTKFLQLTAPLGQQQSFVLLYVDVFHDDRCFHLLNAGGDGGNDQHEGEGDHHPVLEVGHLKQEGHESNDDEDGLLKEHAEKVVLNLPM